MAASEIKLEVSVKDYEVVQSLIEILAKHMDSLPEELKAELSRLVAD